MSVPKKVLQGLKRDGLASLGLQTALYFSRRLEWRGHAWTNRLDFALGADAVRRAHGPLMARNDVFRDRHAGQRCFVIGNGPSINDQDLAPLEAEITLVTNAFFKHPFLDRLSPNYYVLTDPIYFDGSEASRACLIELNARVSSTTYFIPDSASEVINQYALLPADRAYYVGLAGNLAHNLAWSPDLTDVLPGVRTVVQLAIIAALYMGCNPIYLLGMDHDWLSHTSEHKTFYGGRSMANEGARTDWKYKDLMEAVLIMWRGYESIQAVAKSRSAQIVNATRGGFLDVFERQDYEAVVEQSD